MAFDCHSCFWKVFTMRSELISLILAALTLANIAEIISANEYAVKAESKQHVIDFCSHAGCSFVKQVSFCMINLYNKFVIKLSVMLFWEEKYRRVICKPVICRNQDTYKMVCLFFKILIFLIEIYWKSNS